MDLQHLMVSVRLYPPGGPWILTHALVDSGATRSYMDAAFAAHHQVPLRNKPVPVQVEAIDGRLLRSGAVTQETQPLVLCFQQHRELRTLDIASMPRFPLVLGMDWLEAHNVQIDWVKRTVHFPDPCSHAQSGTLAAAPSEEAAPTLPAVYQDYQDVFEERGADQLPPHRPFDCGIDLQPGAPLPVSRLYSLTEPEREALQDFLRKNLERGFIRPSTSPTAAPVLFVKKKCGELRPCHDYRALNKITVPDRYPLPLISELLERVQGAQVFTKLDLRGAYNLIRIRAGDEWKTAFGTRYGQFEYLVMPFGLCNAPAVFQRYINHVFQDLLDKYVVVYLDDILIYSRDPARHEGHVRTVLQRLREHRLYAKLSKCEFHQRTVDFLGHRLSPDGVQMDPGKVTAVQEWAAPRNRKDLQRFLGFANYYRTFIADYAHRTTPLTRLLRPKTPFSWDKEAEEAFQGLKACFQRAPILQHPDPSRPFVVETDASSTALGAVLSQQIGPEAPLLPCAFYSRQLLPAERNYTVWERELLAIKVAFEVWRHHLEGARHPVEVRTDHRNLEYLQTTRKLNQRQIRWALFFSRFQFRIRYIPSSQNQKADALSRKPEDNADTVQQAEPTTILPPAAFLATQEAQPLQVRVREQQRVDAWAQERLRELAEGSSPQYPGLVLHQGLLLHHGRLYIPPGPLRLEVLRMAHDAPAAGHFGRYRTTHLVSREFWWPRLKADVARYVAGCDVCRRAKGPTGRPPGLLQPLPVPPRPWHTVSLDFVVDLPSSRGCTCLLVFSDHFTKMVHCVPCPSVPTAKETAQLYLQHVFRLHGLPERVVSDRGVQFTSRFWRALHQTLGTEVCLSSAYHPQTDGQTERANAVLEQYLRCYCSYQQDDWVDHLALAEFAYNNAVNASTQQTPFQASYGYHPRLFPEVLPASAVPAVTEWLQELQSQQQLLVEQLHQAKEAYKAQADRHRQVGPELRVGDLVWLSTRHLHPSRPSRKLDARFTGPFPIVDQVSPVAFRLRLPATLKVHPVFHRSLLSPVAPPDEFHPNRPRPQPVLVRGEPEYEVERILDSRYRRGKLQYLIDWKGYGPEDRSWEPAANVHAPACLREFHATYPGKPGPDPRLRGGPGRGDGVMAWDSDSEDETEESQPAQESPPPGPAELGQGLDAEEPAPVAVHQELAPGEALLAPEGLDDSVATGEPPPGPSNPSASPDLQRLRAERRRELVAPRRSARLKARGGGAPGGRDCPWP
uniref:Gypsy retrotransposon integrase-like protein 1 n=1 Tax=Podarcis muralis TaxID=64176 RepID=A0A670IJD3_PODMU